MKIGIEGWVRLIFPLLMAFSDLNFKNVDIVSIKDLDLLILELLPFKDFPRLLI
jgi:hypothetical protein